MSNEKQQVEQVFGLTGGELEDGPWIYTYEKDDQKIEGTFLYWYEGVPDYCGAEIPDRHLHEYRTIVQDCLWGLPPDRIEDAEGDVWIRISSFTSSGETPCPFMECDEEPEILPADGCPFCGMMPGEPHEYIYLGNGWTEVVYRKQEDVTAPY
jgi:hypothetical protein